MFPNRFPRHSLSFAIGQSHPRIMSLVNIDREFSDSPCVAFSVAVFTCLRLPHRQVSYLRTCISMISDRLYEHFIFHTANLECIILNGVDLDGKGTFSLFITVLRTEHF